MTDKKPKIFGTDGIRGPVGTFPITVDMILHIGWALGYALRNDKRARVLIGKDTRISGYMIESALQAGLTAAGAKIYLLGPMPTSAIAYLTKAYRANAGIVISASHNPYTDNGIKFFSPDGFKFDQTLETKIEKYLHKDIITENSENLGKTKRIADASGRYIEFCKNTIPHQTSLHGLKIIVDCANGATYHVAPYVFAELGANVTAIFKEPDGKNINLNCGTNHPETLSRIVVKSSADLGIAFDGDGDRVVMVDHKGEILDGDELIYILATGMLKTNRLDGGVVVTHMSNMGLIHALDHAGIQNTQVNVGEQHVISALIENKWHLGAESSGHLTDLRLTTTHDGVVAALQVLTIMMDSGKDLHTLKQGIEKFPQKLKNIPHHGKKLNFEASPFADQYKKCEKELGNNGRILIRYSGTEPVIRLMVECKIESLLDKVMNDLSLLIENEISTS